VEIRSGWSAGQQEMDAGSSYAQALKVEQTIQIIKFLEDQPYANYRRHWVERNTPTGLSNRPYTCLATVGRDCPLCDIGDRPQAVSAFNVALIGDDGVPSLKTWDVGARLFNVLKSFSNDPKIGPLTAGYFAVSKSGGGRRSGGSVQHNVIPVKPHSLEEDYGVPEPSPGDVSRLGIYTPTIITIPKRSEMEEIAAEITEE
jgi:hypothetical protein